MPLKLALLGFEFATDSRKLGEPSPFHFEVWRKGTIEVRVDHRDRNVEVRTLQKAGVELADLNQLELLDKMMNTDENLKMNEMFEYKNL